MWWISRGIVYGLPPGPSAPVAGGAPRVWRASPHVAYVTPSRLATRTASSNSPSACACHLESFPSAASHLPGGRGRGEGWGWRGGGGGGKAIIRRGQIHGTAGATCYTDVLDGLSVNAPPTLRPPVEATGQKT